MTKPENKKPQSWTPGDDINPEDINATSLGDIVLALQNVLDHLKHPKKIALDKAEIESALELAIDLSKDLGRLSSDIDDVENWISEKDDPGNIATLDILREALTDYLPPWVWSEALIAAEAGDTMRVRKVFELS